MATIISIETLEKHRSLLEHVANTYFAETPPRHCEAPAKPKIEWLNLSETVTKNVTIRLRILEDMPSIHAMREYYPRYIVLHDNSVVGDRFYDSKECYYLEPVQQWLDSVGSMERVQASTKAFKEELIAATWHPERIERLLEAGADLENI